MKWSSERIGKRGVPGCSLSNWYHCFLSPVTFSCLHAGARLTLICFLVESSKSFWFSLPCFCDFFPSCPFSFY